MRFSPVGEFVYMNPLEFHIARNGKTCTIVTPEFTDAGSWNIRIMAGGQFYIFSDGNSMFRVLQ